MSELYAIGGVRAQLALMLLFTDEELGAGNRWEMP
jgi:hypothetical protein